MIGLDMIFLFLGKAVRVHVCALVTLILVVSFEKVLKHIHTSISETSR